MKKRNLKPIIISALMAVSFGATTVGTSFALFTDRADTSITVTAGIVEVESEIELVSYFSTVEGDEADVKVDLTNKTSHTNPLTGSKFTLDPESKTVAIDKMLPGDTLVVKITNKNKSNVITKTRLATTHSTMANKEDLFPALSMNIAAVDGNNQAIAQPTKWRQTPAAGNLTEGDTISVATVRISFDEINEGILAREDGENNKFQDAACLINFALEAVQGNAKINPIDEINAYMLQNAMTGNHNATMHDAMEDVAALEYTAEVLAGYVYSIDDEQFVAENSVAAGKEYKYFKIYESMPTTQSFSIYAMGANWANTTINPLTVGFDAGVTTTASLKYAREDSANPHDIVIRTNGGELIVDAPHDSVHHYGDAASVTILSVAGKSYHENGAVSFVEIAGGHFVFEKEAAVKAMHFDATGDTFKNADYLTISLDISKIETTALPEFSRDAVTIAENGTYVAEVKSDESEYIWLFGNGVKEQMVVTDTDEAIAENGHLKEGIEKGAEDGSVAEQIANPALRNDEGKLVDEEGALVEPEAAVVEQLPNKEDIKEGNVDYDGGLGTLENPFLISNAEQFNNMYYANKAYKLTANIDFKGEAPKAKMNAGLHIDGNNKTILNAAGPLFNQNWIYDLHVENLNFDNCVSDGSLFCFAGSYAVTDKQEFINIDVNNCTAKGGSLFIPWVYSDYNVLIKDCDIRNTRIDDSKGSQGFVATFVGNSKKTVTVKNCTALINLESSNWQAAGFLGTNGSIIDSALLQGSVLTQKSTNSISAMTGSGTITNSTCNATIVAPTIAQMKNNGFADTVLFNLADLGFSAADFAINSDGSITYTGNVAIAKMAITQRVTFDRLHDGVFENGGFPNPIGDVVYKTDVEAGTIANALNYITDVKNVTSTYSDILYCTVDALPAGATFNEYGCAFVDGTLYVDADQAEGEYTSNYISGTLKSGQDINTINVTVYLDCFDASNNLLAKLYKTYSVALNK